MSVDARWCIVQALDGSRKRPWWHCLGCGKINQRVMLVHRRCSSCQRNEATAPPFVIEDVLQDTSTVPYPFNHAPRSMKPDDISVKEFSDLTNVYCYSYEAPPLERAYVKHIFTGPYEDLKTQATGLFYLIQEGVELKWQHLSIGVAEGPYYSWRSPAGGLADSEVPQCIHQARKLIYRAVTNYGDKDPGDEIDLDEMMGDEPPADPLPSSSSYNPSKDDNEIAWKNGINNFVILAWTASGTKKGTFISAQEHPVYVLCLGAPVELDLEQCLPISPEHAATVDAESNLAVNQDVVIQDVPVPEPEAEEAGQNLKGKKPRKSKKNTATATGQETGANLKGTKKGKEKTTVHQPKPKPAVPPHERLKINMVHGDVLILSGEFVYTLTRSGMSILIFGMHEL
ncbi:hypothetical protein BJ322DRAFT_827862 [Thelephora terrestris]|uniref:Uncharacterized protein n=1 Tax=Thelephora terrestris TaxID=56493 RepID=A0A9P6HG23_9AGAM|nr:hypothetical protein BJ322DRAFT_827862 [Thelephora terrestris]